MMPRMRRMSTHGCPARNDIHFTRCAVFIVLAVLGIATAETVYEALGQYRDLFKFQEMVNRDEVLRKLLQHWPVTVFAPTDDAIVRNEEWIVGRENKVVSYHVLNLVANKSLFPFTSTTSLAGAPPLYLGVKQSLGYWHEKEYFVNNAKIMRTNKYMSQEGYEQILYVIDEILQPYVSSSSLPPNANELLQNPMLYNIIEPLSAFAFRVEQEKLGELFERDGNHTFFIPVGAGVGHNFNRQVVDSWVVRGHVIPRHVLFTRLAGTQSYASESYGEDIKVELSIVNETNAVGNSYMLYAQSNTMHSDYGHKKGVVLSKILKPNIPVKNGVVHLIESPLMIIDITVWKFLNNEKESRLSEFLQLVNYAPDFKEILMSTPEKTLFAPSNDAIRQLPRETIEAIKTNITAITNLLMLHLVMKSISTDDVLYGRHREYLSADNRNALYFRVIGNEQNKTLTVDGGGVKAAAIQADIGAVDGMVHIVDRLLGLPYQTVYRKMAADPDLRTSYHLSQQDDWVSTLDSHDKRFTFFVPSNEAWDDIKHQMPTEFFELNSGVATYHVHKILDRHLVVGREIRYNDLHRIQQIQMVDDVFKVKRASDTDGSGLFAYGDKVIEWEGIEARIVRPDVQAVNGIIHVIDRVMMSSSDMTGAAPSTIHRGKPTATVVTAGVLLLTIVMSAVMSL